MTRFLIMPDVNIFEKPQPYPLPKGEGGGVPGRREGAHLP